MLDLSWNQLRMKGAVAFCAGLKVKLYIALNIISLVRIIPHGVDFQVNMMLKHLDLSWNGFGNEGALAMGEALKFNNTLVHLNLNNNRLTNEGVSMLCLGLEYNDNLRVLQVHSSPL